MSSALLAKMGLIAAHCVNVVQMSELYPTKLRTTAMGFTITTSRIGAILAPFTKELGVVFFSWAPKVVDIAGCACLILVSLPLPETFKEPLPDTLHDIKMANMSQFVEHCDCVMLTLYKKSARSGRACMGSRFKKRYIQAKSSQTFEEVPFDAESWITPVETKIQALIKTTMDVDASPSQPQEDSTDCAGDWLTVKRRQQRHKEAPKNSDPAPEAQKRSPRPKQHLKVILRPREGLVFSKWPTPVIARANLIVRIESKQNIAVVSTSSEYMAARIRDISTVHLGVKEYAVATYIAPPANSARGVAHGIPQGTTDAELMRGLEERFRGTSPSTEASYAAYPIDTQSRYATRAIKWGIEPTFARTRTNPPAKDANALRDCYQRHARRTSHARNRHTKTTPRQNNRARVADSDPDLGPARGPDPGRDRNNEEQVSWADRSLPKSQRQNDKTKPHIQPSRNAETNTNNTVQAFTALVQELRVEIAEFCAHLKEERSRNKPPAQESSPEPRTPPQPPQRACAASVAPETVEEMNTDSPPEPNPTAQPIDARVTACEKGIHENRKAIQELHMQMEKGFDEIRQMITHRHETS
ncbi:hypothetical protein HPB49_004120 [Dermacentor silvarum]|uniref:Uncharacterized protein n=1 Tax=Dermacentor silvarum TaxID=543639 RepID=A0ACB8DUF5_DERSI|nr:hypothetical protein HPB49_004120 [Dermacentor silvarum]